MNQISKHLIHWQLSFFHELMYFFPFYNSYKVYPTNKHRMSLFLAKKLFLVYLFYFSAMWNLTGSQNLAYFCVVVVNLLNSFISYQLLLLLVVFFSMILKPSVICACVCFCVIPFDAFIVWASVTFRLYMFERFLSKNPLHIYIANTDSL